MNGFSTERILAQSKCVLLIVEIGYVGQRKTCQIPKARIKAIKCIAALKTHFFDYFLIEVVKQFLTRLILNLADPASRSLRRHRIQIRFCCGVRHF